MRRVLVFHKVCFDALRVPAGPFPRSLDFFVDGEAPASSSHSVRDVHEAEIVRWVLGHPMTRDLTSAKFGLGARHAHRFRVTDPILPRTNPRPGDIDWISVDPSRPDLALAAECKRVKVQALRDGQDHVNRVKSLGKGVVQANQLSALGFYQTYLIILVLVDGRVRTENNFVFRGMSDATFQRIYEFPWRDELDGNVGVVFIEVEQPSHRSHESTANIGICVDRPAVLRDQTSKLTNKVRFLFSRP